MLEIFSQLSANLFLCLVMKLFVMLVMTNITHAKFVGQYLQSFRFRLAITRSWSFVSFKMADSRLSNSEILCSQDKPFLTLVLLPEFCINVHFPNFFEVEAKNSITDDLRKFFRCLGKSHNFLINK